MKFLAEFQVSKPELPLEYRKSYIAFLKKCLSEVNEGTYFERYYEKGKEKPFTFAIHMQKPVFEKEKICLEGNKVSMTFSSADDMTSFLFFSAFLNQKNRSFPLENGNYMILKNVVQKREEDVRGKQVLVHMLSPLCIREHTKEGNKDYYYSYAHPDFQRKAKTVIKRQLLAAGFSESLADDVQIVPVNCKKIIVKHYGNQLECTLGDLLLKGDKAVLNYLVKAGVGSRSSAGFGLCSVLMDEGGENFENENTRGTI